MNNIILRRRKLGRGSCKAIAAKSVMGFKVVRNDNPIPQPIGVLIRWGCTSAINGRALVATINTAKAIHQVNDKLGFRRTMQEHGLCPLTVFDVDDMDYPHLSTGYPCVVRPKHHSQGRDLHVCENKAELMAATRRYVADGYYISKLIHKVAEYRVFVVQGRVVCVANKTPGNPDQVAWNVAQGGRFDNVSWGEWPLKAVRVSVEAFNLSDLDFGGVDVMVDAEGNAYVVEINSAPSLTSDYRQSCFAKAFDYIVANGKERIPLIERRGGYKKFIHPAVCQDAKGVV